jgi:hypothetical protein
MTHGRPLSNAPALPACCLNSAKLLLLLPPCRQAAGARHSPIHGPNQWPSQVPQFDAALRQYIHEMTGLGAALMRGIAMALGLQVTACCHALPLSGLLVPLLNTPLLAYC